MQITGRKSKRRARLFKALFFGAGLSLLAGILSFVWFKVDPISFRHVAFEPLRDGLFFYRELQPISGWNKLQAAPGFRSRRVEIPKQGPQDLTVVADLWEPENGSELRPALLILHGSSQRGRRQGLVRMLAREFQRSGWVVLTPDARGFGESEAPKRIQDPEGWQAAGDINRCLAFLSQLHSVDKKRIVVLGHSMGGASALEAALNDSRVAALILIGPTRYRPGAEATFWHRVRFSAVRNLREVISEKVMLDNMVQRDIGRYALEGRLRAAPQPLLLLDGALESKADRDFLREVSRELSDASEYHTMPNVGHYCGVYHIPITDFIVWRQDLFEACTAPSRVFLERSLGVVTTSEEGGHVE